MIDSPTALGDAATVINTVVQLFNAGSSNSLTLNNDNIAIPIHSLSQ